jgi:hypothetical protein
MRSIYDILKELGEHPDYVCGDVWTKDMVLSHLESHYESQYYFSGGLNNDTEINLENSDLTDGDWIAIEDHIQNNYDHIEDPIPIWDLEVLDKRLRRKINLDNLIKD